MFTFPFTMMSSADDAYSPAAALYLDGSADYLSWTPSGAAASDTNKTISFWVKRAKFGSVQWVLDVSSNGDQIQYTADNKLEVSLNATTDSHYTTKAVYRDPTAWTNIVIAFDTDSDTAANKKRLWINGVLQEDAVLDNHDDPADDANVDWMKQSIAHNIGRRGNNSQFFEGYIADFIGIDGALDADSFGQTNSSGIWVPKNPSTISMPSNSFWLAFDDAAFSTYGVGKDSSGRGNHWTPTSLAAAQIVKDNPSNNSDEGVGNYCTWNPLQWEGNSSNSPVPVFSEGNLRAKNTSAVGACSFVGTVKMHSGKFYWEVTCNATSTGVTDGYPYIGVIRDDEPPNFPDTYVAIANTYGPQQGYAVDNTGSKWVSGTETTSFISSYSAGVIIMIALDLDNGKIWFGRNGSWPNSGNPATGSNEAYSSIPAGYGWLPHSTEYNNSDTTANFGQRSFSYTVPTGFNAGISTHMLPDPTVTDPSAFYKTILYNGSNDSPYSVTGIADSGGTTWTPDFVWLKQRTSSTRDHYVFDSVRGQGKALHPSYVSSEDSTLTHGKLSDFDNGGFELSDGSGSGVSVKESGGTFVAWCLKANGSGSANTDGRSAGSTSEYDSTVSVASHSGFSIVKWTAPGSVASGARVGHGMGKKPEVIIIKSTTDGSDGWHFWHKDLSGVDEYLKLNTNHAETSDGWNGSSGGKAWDGHQNTNTSTFSVGDGSGTNWTNDANQTYIAYCFARTKNFCAIGRYEGANNANGSFVICDDGSSGFKPAFLLIKNIDSAEDWYIFDSTRSTYNPTGHILAAQSNAVERTSADNQVHLTANGFKFFDIGSLNAGTNTDNSYIYLAFAETPFGSNNRAR